MSTVPSPRAFLKPEPLQAPPPQSRAGADPDQDRPDPGSWTPDDVESYRRILAHLEGLLQACEHVRQAHSACRGCDLCWDAEGLAWPVEMFASAIDSTAPPESSLRALRACQPEDVVADVFVRAEAW